MVAGFVAIGRLSLVKTTSFYALTRPAAASSVLYIHRNGHPFERESVKRYEDTNPVCRGATFLFLFEVERKGGLLSSLMADDPLRRT